MIRGVHNVGARRCHGLMPLRRLASGLKRKHAQTETLALKGNRQPNRASPDDADIRKERAVRQGGQDGQPGAPCMPCRITIQISSGICCRQVELRPLAYAL
jgi:hypothetical protein